MSTVSMPVATPARGAMATIVAAGIVVGVLDGIFAMLVQFAVLESLAPVQLFQGIASGLLGAAAFSGGVATAVLGLALHFAFAHAWAAVYLIGSKQMSVLRRTRYGTIISGLSFGVLVWLVMNLAVKPMGGIPPTPVVSGMFLVMLTGHVVVVGLPIAVIARRHTPT